MSLGHKQLSKTNYLTNHLDTTKPPETTISPTTTKNVKKSEKFFRKFQKEIDKTHTNHQTEHYFETKATTSNPFELVKRQRKLLNTPAGTHVQEFSLYDHSLPVISPTNGIGYPVKLSKTALKAHNLMMNQERLSAIPVGVDRLKKTYNEQHAESVSRFERQTTFSLNTHELKNTSQISYQSSTKPMITLAPVKIKIKTNTTPTTNITPNSFQSKEFTAHIYKKAIKSLNTKHRQLQLQHDTFLHTSRHSDLSSRSTSNMSIKTQSTAAFTANKNSGLMFIEEKSDLSEDVNVLTPGKPVFSKSLADKIARARRVNVTSKMSESYESFKGVVVVDDEKHAIMNRVVTKTGLHLRRDRDGKKI